MIGKLAGGLFLTIPLQAYELISVKNLIQEYKLTVLVMTGDGFVLFALQRGNTQ
jgi:hypothetical protein